MALRVSLGCALAILCDATNAYGGTMGPLLNDTTTVDNCDISPGGQDALCTDLGVFADATMCAAACAGVQYCSAITWHGPSTGEWAGHCLAVRSYLLALCNIV